MLILFDIDGTLLRSERAGIKAMTVAMNEVYPPRHEGDLSDAEAINSPGWLDPLIWQALMEQRDLEQNQEGHDAFRSAYGRIFNAVIQERNPVHALPGAEAAVRWVHEHPQFESALLTGNYPETGTLKVEAAGIDPGMFRFGTWGSEAESRRGLPPIAIDKATVNPTLLGVILSANLVAVALFAGEMSGVSLGSLTAALPAAAPVV